MSEHLNYVIENHPEYIEKFDLNFNNYKSLCEEVEYILNKQINDNETQISAITSRPKSKPSFCEKIRRKNYDDPFKEITDFAGVRIVFLYSKDRKKIEEIIEAEFEIIDKEDKISGNNIDKFGYGALHYLIKIKNNHSGARYDEIKDLVCEIQVKTILQDAWSLVAHHLSYKQESDVPPQLRRKLNALSGLFEIADDQFENIRTARVEYHRTMKLEIENNPEISLEKEITIDNLIAYLEYKFPERNKITMDHAVGISEILINTGYNTLKKVDDLLSKTIDAISAYEKKSPPIDKNDVHNTTFTQGGVLIYAQLFINLKAKEIEGKLEEDGFILNQKEMVRYLDLVK
ncbi:MAG: hypothetical protein GY714_12255 [Desulfobacterales bacterium]|nr:hypothetical protein [Desulfobacterales bacterium]